MTKDAITPKQRYFDKRYREAPLVECACGCGEQIKSVDRYARPKKFVSGHNARKYYGVEATNWAREKRWRVKNPEKVAEGKKRFYRKRKLRGMAELGNKCTHCGLEYNGKNGPAFEFHHEDPSIKESGITRMITTYKWETVQIELVKCILLCSICHNMHHSEEW